ncbi:MAG: DUF3857 domain-containing protein [Kiritimatiellae bacterium]|nr:DUF3857 domain-containing protein [Kiritimatiellia bacterium]
MIRCTPASTALLLLPLFIARNVSAWLAIDPTAARRLAEQCDPAFIANADLVVLDQFERARYGPDGTSTSWYENCTLVLTEKGRRDLAELSIRFLSMYSTIEVARVELVRPDGRHEPVDMSRTTRVAIHADQMAENIYDPDIKVLAIGVPGIETGDVVCVSLVERRHRTRIPGHWFDLCMLEGESPLLRAVYEVEAPTERPLRHLALRGGPAGHVRYEEEPWAGGTRHRWIATNVPRMFPEPRMPEPGGVLQRVLVSTCSDWPEVSRWYWNLCRPRMTPDDTLRQQVRNLVGDRPDERTRADVLFTFVSQHIRYLGITAETEAPGYEPHDVTLTLRQRHGVCRDKAALLAAMASEAGLRGFPVLIHAGMSLDPEVPLPYFNHAIAAIRFSDDTTALLDPTDEASRDWLPAYLAHRSYLIATPVGEPLRISPIPPAESNLVRLVTESRLGPDGRLLGRCAAVFLGINDNAYRNYLARRSTTERRRFFETVAQSALPGCRIRALTLDPPDLRDRSRPLRAEWEFEAPAPAVLTGEIALLSPPSFARAFGVIHRELDALSLEHRRYPLRLRSTGGVDETCQVETTRLPMPPLHVPPPHRVELPTVRSAVDWEVDGNILRRHHRWTFHAIEIAPEAYRQFRDAVRALVSEQRRRVVFRASPAPSASSAAPPDPPPAAPDLDIQRHITDVVWIGPGAWMVTNEVEQVLLTYAGVKNAAELKLPFLERHDEPRVLLAEVITPEGTTNVPAPRDLQIMDQPWTAGAPRYPAGRLLVAGLPAVAPGARIRYRTLLTVRNRPFFAEAPVLAGRDPVRERIVRLYAPTGIALRVVEPSAAKLARREDYIRNGMQVQAWRILQIPATAREPSEPPPWLAGRCWIFSDGDWAGYARQLRERLEQAASQSREVTEHARAIAPTTLPLKDRLRLIRDAVILRVRAAGPSPTSLPSDALTPADRVWADGYGHSADRAIVLMAMLRAIELSPEWLLATPVPGSAAPHAPFCEAPWLSPFDRVLLRVPLPDGSAVLLNDTDQYAVIGASPSRGSLALDLVDGRIITLPDPPELSDRTEIEFQIALNADGSARVLRRTRFYGMHHADHVRQLCELTPEELRRRDLAELAEIALDADPDGPPLHILNEHPAVEELRFRIASLAQRAGVWWHLEPPLPLTTIPGVQGERRTQPLYWEKPFRETITIPIRPPPAFAAFPDLPIPMAWSDPGSGTIQVSVARGADGTLSYTLQTALAAGLHPPSAFDKLLNVLQRLRHPASRTWAGRVAAPTP